MGLGLVSRVRVRVRTSVRVRTRIRVRCKKIARVNVRVAMIVSEGAFL